MTVNQSPTSGYTLVLSAAAGLLVGLSIIFFWLRAGELVACRAPRIYGSV